MQPFAHRQIKSAVFVKQGIAPTTITDGNSVNTYDAAPQPNAGIDISNIGRIIPRRLMVIVNVGAVSGTGTLNVSLRDSQNPITHANGNNSNLVATLGKITKPGIYFSEIDLNHIFPNATQDTNFIMKNQTVRATADGCDFTVGVTLLYCFMDKLKPNQEATELAVVYNN